MTLKRLMISIGVLALLVGIGIAWLWQYAYSPEGRARTIITQLRGDTTTLRGWMLQHDVIPAGFCDSPQNVPEDACARNCRWMATVGDAELDYKYVIVLNRVAAASDAMVELGHTALPIAIGAMQENNEEVRLTGILACGKSHDSSAIEPLVRCANESILRRSNPIMKGDDGYTYEMCCIKSLIEIGPEASGPLLRISKKCSLDVQNSMPAALVEKWGAAALPNILEFLDHPGDIRSHEGLCVVEAAADALGDLGDKRAVPSLEALLRAPWYQGTRAMKALQKLGVKSPQSSHPVTGAGH